MEPSKDKLEPAKQTGTCNTKRNPCWTPLSPPNSVTWEHCRRSWPASLRSCLGTPGAEAEGEDVVGG